MLPRDRVFAALEHREPDRVPWGEHSIDYNVYEDILGRPTLVQAKMRETRAYWEGRRDEVVECIKRDRLDLIRALDMDIVFVSRVPPRGYHPDPMEQVDEETFRDEAGNVFRISATTHDLMLFEPNRDAFVPPTVDSVQEQIDRLEDEALPDPSGSEWEVVRHAVGEMKDTHFIMAFCSDLAFPAAHGKGTPKARGDGHRRGAAALVLAAAAPLFTCPSPRPSTPAATP